MASEAQANSYRFVEALELVERALKLPDLAGQMFALELARARLLLAVGHPASAIAASTLAINAADSDAERAVGMIAMASGMRLVDRTREGLDVLARAQPLAEQAGLTLDLSHLHELRGNLLFVLGQAHACQLAHETALALARAAGSAEAECAALGGLGDACFAQSQIVSGAHRIRECLAMAREQGFLKIEMAYLPMLGWAEYYMMRLPKAVGLSEQALAMAARLRNPRAEMMAMSQLVMLDGWRAHRAGARVRAARLR